jgi:uncharacterized RDD family membrane protein YckC
MIMELKYKRAVAFLIDFSIVTSIVSLIHNFFSTALYIKEVELQNFKIVNKITFDFIFMMLYLVLFDFIYKGRTIGKILMKINILTQNNEILNQKELIIRTLFKTLSFIFLPIAILLYLINGYTFQDSILKTKSMELKEFFK